ncbi:hypothetical protein U1Q18_014099 [Sarracenia purpurea var. burkii]
MSRLVGVSPWVDNETLYAIFPSFSYKGKYRSILVGRTVPATSPVIQKPPTVARHQQSIEKIACPKAQNGFLEAAARKFKKARELSRLPSPPLFSLRPAIRSFPATLHCFSTVPSGHLSGRLSVHFRRHFIAFQPYPLVYIHHRRPR